MKKYLKAGAFVLSLALAAWFIYLVDMFTGYPVSYFIVKDALDTYMEETYAGTDFIADKPHRVIKLGGFLVDVHSPSSQDSSFRIQMNCDGTIESDTYESNVKSGINTAMRLSHEYQELTRTIFESAVFPFEATCSGSFENAISGNSEVLNEPGTYPDKWDVKELVLDQKYDISQLSGQYGSLYLNVTTDDVSVGTAAEALLELRNIMEKSNLPFKSVDLWVCSQEQDPSEKPKETIHILNFGWDDIHEDGLEDRVQNAIHATNAHYN